MNEMTIYEICTVIKAELQTTCDSFVSIGFYLKQVRDRSLYKETGHKDIWEFAQDQFGISKSSASRFMAINDKFSVDGNSPLLIEQYKDFSSSKLSEMLTLSDKQLKQVKPDMTREQIREMKPKKQKSASAIVEKKQYSECAAYQGHKTCEGCYYDQLDNCPYDRSDMPFPDQVELNDTTEILPSVAPAQQETKSHYCNDFGYDCNLEERRSIARDIGCDCTASCCCKCEEMEDCGAHCFVSTERKSKLVEETEDNERISSTPLRPELKGFMDDPYCPSCGIRLTYRCNCECGQIIDWTTVAPLFDYEEEQIKKLVEKKAEEYIQNTNSMIENTVADDIVQPDLPVLRNNDQRKAFIEEYQTWPVWIDIELTGERYYRYDFDNGVSMVVKVSTCHRWNGSGGYEKEISYGREQYYLLGEKVDVRWKPENPTFSESESNKSGLIDYLKEYQKGGK